MEHVAGDVLAFFHNFLLNMFLAVIKENYRKCVKQFSYSTLLLKIITQMFLKHFCLLNTKLTVYNIFLMLQNDCQIIQHYALIPVVHVLSWRLKKLLFKNSSNWNTGGNDSKILVACNFDLGGGVHKKFRASARFPPSPTPLGEHWWVIDHKRSSLNKLIRIQTKYASYITELFENTTAFFSVLCLLLYECPNYRLNWFEQQTLYLPKCVMSDACGLGCEH